MALSAESTQTAIKQAARRPTRIIPAIPLKLTQRRKQSTSAAKNVDQYASRSPQAPVGSSPSPAPTQASTASDENRVKSPESKPAVTTLRIDTGAQLQHQPLGLSPAEAPLSAANTEFSINHESAGPHDLERQPTYRLPPPFYPATHPSVHSPARSTAFPSYPPHPCIDPYRRPTAGQNAPSLASHTSTAGTPQNGMVYGSDGAYYPYVPFLNVSYQMPFLPSGNPSRESESYPSYPQTDNCSKNPANSDSYYPPQHPFEYPQSYGPMLSPAPPESFSPFSSVSPPGGSLSSLPTASSDGAAPSNPAEMLASSSPSVLDEAQEGHDLQTEASLEGTARGNERENALSWNDSGTVEEKFMISAAPEQSKIQDHVLAHFGSRDLADYVIQFRHEQSRFRPVEIPAHGLIIAQSPYLRSLMASSTDQHYPRTLVVDTNDRALSGEAFQLALGRLYGGALLEDEVDGSTEDRVQSAVAYAAAGQLLQMEEVARRGVELTTRLISWETAEQVLGLVAENDVENPWSEEVKKSNEAEVEGPQETATADSVQRQLVAATTEFISQHFPSEFPLDRDAPDMTLCPRLPACDAPSPAPQSAHPGLNGIQFGDHPTEEARVQIPPLQEINPTTKIISSILLSCPFSILKSILENGTLGNVAMTSRQELARAVVEERDNRRTTLLRRDRTPYVERRAKGAEWAVVGWRELVVMKGKKGEKGGKGGKEEKGEKGAKGDVGFSTGVEIRRVWKGYRTPFEGKKWRK
ncbi:MAG: hypothetical protein M1838_005097 [Thelocarpon superellum]|nr:MAG: hypothetical protein M1838_005097 [Thelocarpon superellum]